MTNTLLEAALKYQTQGWSVIPLHAEGKQPLFSWTKYQNERATREQILAWWKANPNANVGIVTGKISSLVAVDIDMPGKERDILALAPTSCISQTGSGGFHLLYQYPFDKMVSLKTIANRVGMIEGVDVRADGGYIVAPPSIHPDGGQYSWVSQDTPEEVSERLWEMLQGQQQEQPFENSEHWFGKLFDNGAPEGERNDSCARMAGFLASKKFPQDITTSILVTWNERKNSEPLPLKEIRTTIESVYKKHRSSSSKKTHKGLGLTEFSPYMRKHIDSSVNWIIEGWLPDETIAFMVAAPGSYKTWLLLDLAISVASGTDFLKLFPTKSSGPVLIFQQEDPHGGIAQRLSTIFWSRFSPRMWSEGDNFWVDFGPTLPIHIHEDRNLHFDNPEIMDMLEARIAKIRPKLILIDPLYSAASTDEYMAKSTEHMFRLKRLRDEYGCTFVIAHHTKKKSLTAGQGSEREDLWGSQFLNAFLETGWQIRATKQKNCITVRRHFKVSENKDEINLAFHIDTNPDDPSYRVSIEESVTESPDDQLLEKILTALEAGPMIQAALSRQLNISESTIGRKLKKLCEEGRLYRHENGAYSLKDLT